MQCINGKNTTAVADSLDNTNNVDMNDEKHKKREPLSLLFSGPEGVGKRETTKVLLNLLFPNCPSTSTTLTTQPVQFCESEDTNTCRMDFYDSLINNNRNGVVLNLNGVDFASTDDNDTTNDESDIATRLVTIILEYISFRQQSGCIVLINHIEEISTEVWKEVVWLMKKSVVTFRRRRRRKTKQSSLSLLFNSVKEKFRELIQYPQEEEEDDEEEVEVWLGNTIFISTTELGVDKTFQLVRKYSRSFESLPWMELQQMVNEDFDTRFGASVSYMNSIIIICVRIYILSFH